jgi:aspartate 1-decarboxylase
MFVTMLKSKIHRARILDANVNYEGSIALDPTLMKKADIREYEQVHIYNVDNGERFITYAIKGKDGDVCINGAAARKVNIGDTIIICSYCMVDERDTHWVKPRVVHIERAINEEE